MSNSSITHELTGLQAQQEASRILQKNVDMPCIACYYAGEAWPEAGNRGNLFYALTVDLKRLGMSETEARRKILNYYKRVPTEILNSPGKDGRSFTESELESIIRSTFKSKSTKAYLCRSGFWDSTCIGPDMCQFNKLHTKKQDRESIYYDFIFLWLGAKDENQKKLLNETEVRTYLAIDAIEKLRGYHPGSLLFASWSEIAKYSGLNARKIGPALENLHWAGLILYKKGIAQERGTASEMKRIVPIPLPPAQKA